MGETELLQKRCKPCEGGMPALNEEQACQYLKKLNGWTQEKGQISKTFDFKNYDETISFVNAVAWIAHREDHHPDISFGYKKCRVVYSTHAVKGLSENDFICAAKIDALLK